MNPIKLQELSGEQLAQLIQQNYEQIIQVQSALVVLDKELQRRLQEKNDADNKGRD
jgi:Na+/phosphate symporter